jgi:hypothetical protein
MEGGNEAIMRVTKQGHSIELRNLASQHWHRNVATKPTITLQFIGVTREKLPFKITWTYLFWRELLFEVIGKGLAGGFVDVHK